MRKRNLEKTRDLPSLGSLTWENHLEKQVLINLRLKSRLVLKSLKAWRKLSPLISLLWLTSKSTSAWEKLATLKLSSTQMKKTGTVPGQMLKSKAWPENCYKCECFRYRSRWKTKTTSFQRSSRRSRSTLNTPLKNWNTSIPAQICTPWSWSSYSFRKSHFMNF